MEAGWTANASKFFPIISKIFQHFLKSSQNRRLGVVLGALGASWGVLGRLSGVSGAHYQASSTPSGQVASKPHDKEPSWSHLRRVLNGFWPRGGLHDRGVPRRYHRGPPKSTSVARQPVCSICEGS